MPKRHQTTSLGPFIRLVYILPIVSPRLPLSRRSIVVLFGRVAVLPCRSSPHEQLLVAVLGGPSMVREWPLLLSWCRFIVIDQNQGPKQCYRCLGPFLPLGLGIGGGRLRASTALVVVVDVVGQTVGIFCCLASACLRNSTKFVSISVFGRSPDLSGEGLSWASCRSLTQNVSLHCRWL